MAGRSHQASSEGIEKAKQALDKNSLNQVSLAEDLGFSRATVNNFFAGKPVDRKYFSQICEKLGFEWEEIVTKPPTEPETNQDSSINIDGLVQDVRETIKPLIQERCGTMRVLDMTQPIGLDDIYTNVNILERITGKRRKEIAELLQDCKNEDFDRFGLGKITEKRVPGLEAVKKYPKLMILGKPGAGKTTFLKYLAIQCIKGEFQAERVPIFVTLKDFAEAANKPALLKYISENATNQVSPKGGILETQLIPSIKNVIIHGKALVLLDGLDEIREEDSTRVLKEIDKFSKIFNENHFVITCRIAAKEYTFEKFTEVEVADFDDEQITTFANNWFKNKAVKPANFIKRLEDNKRIQELAASPLLLTLLCLAFEESGDFPANRSELYKEGLDALLKKWDAKRGIEREQLYKKLSVQRKEDLLSKIALTTFEQSDYFFKQKIAEQYITEYIRNLPDANTDPEALQLDSEKVLKSIEAQHGLLVEQAKGIYSFSHLTFHEYFTAREFVVVKHSSDEALQSLVNHITDKRWREVFLLAVAMSPSADNLLQLMKQKVDALIATDKKLQQFLMWVSQKSVSVECPHKLVGVRAFYFDLALASAEKGDPYINFYPTSLTCILDPTFVIEGPLEFDSADFLIDFYLANTLAHAIINVIDTDLIVPNHYGASLDYELHRSLQNLEKQIIDWEDEVDFHYWEEKLPAWTEKFRNLIIEQRNIGYDWQFSNEQNKLRQQYEDANLLLIECLNSDCYVSREVRQHIEDTLLLPIAELENYKLKSNP